MFNYFPHFLPSSVIVIGAGGTGSRLIPGLAQLIKTCLRKHNPQAMLERCDLYVIDGDVVENKNLTRQHFVPSDVGRNKAVAVAERYSRAFGINVIPCAKFLKADTPEIFDGPAGPASFVSIFQNAVVVFAVDSAKARREILQFMNRFCTTNLFVVDAGNEDDFGQIKFFTGHYLYQDPPTKETLYGLPKQIPSSIQTSFIPFDFQYYRDLGESAVERSCEELPQTLAINNMMAAMMLSVIQNFMQMRPMNYDGQTYSLKGGMGTNWNTAFSWSRRIVDFSRRESDVTSFLAGRKEARINPGTTLTLANGNENDIFSRLHLQCIIDLKSAGLKLLPDGSTEGIAVPKPPELKAAAKKAQKVEAEEAVLPAPPLRVMQPIPEAPTLVAIPR